MEVHFFQGLPERAVHRIFSFLTFSDIAKFRVVDKYFNSICSRILNQTFLSLSYSLDSLILRSLYEIRTFSINNANENKMNKITSACLRHKIYKILKSEASVLYAVCGRYIEFGIYCFTGGKILDYYENVISSPEYFSQIYSNITVQLFLLSQEFMDYFEEIVEPIILTKYSSCIWFGTKILDLLDSYISSNFHIEATYNGRTCQVSGRYEILNAHSLTPPPKIKIASEDKSENLRSLKILVTYLRNQLRWNNFFHCIDSTCIQENIGKSDKKSRNFFSNFNDDLQIHDNQKAWADENGETPEFIFDKTFSRWLDNCSPSENISFIVELVCSKYCAPMRVVPHIEAAAKRKLQLGKYENLTFREVLKHISECYEFNMSLKVILPEAERRVSVENFLELYHDADNCIFSQNVKELPL